MSTRTLEQPVVSQESEGRWLPEMILRYIPAHVLRKLPAHVVRAERAVPVGLERETLVLAVEDASDFDMQERIRYIAARDLRVIEVAADCIDQAIAQYYPHTEEEPDESLASPCSVDFSPHVTWLA